MHNVKKKKKEKLINYFKHVLSNILLPCQSDMNRIIILLDFIYIICQYLDMQMIWCLHK